MTTQTNTLNNLIIVTTLFPSNEVFASIQDLQADWNNEVEANDQTPLTFRIENGNVICRSFNETTKEAHEEQCGYQIKNNQYGFLCGHPGYSHGTFFYPSVAECCELLRQCFSNEEVSEEQLLSDIDEEERNNPAYLIPYTTLKSLQPHSKPHFDFYETPFNGIVAIDEDTYNELQEQLQENP